MSFAFLSAFTKAGGNQAIQAVTGVLATRAPGISLAANEIMNEDDLDKADEIIQRTRHQVDEAQAHFDTTNRRYQELMGAADVMQTDITGFQAIIDNPNASTEDKTAATAKLTATQTSLDGLVTKIEGVAPDLDRYKTELAETQGFLREAEEAYQAKAKRLINSKEEGETARREMDRAKLAEETAKARESDARVIAGLTASPDAANPAIAAMRAKTQESLDHAAQSRHKADTLTKTATHGEDDPIIQAALDKAKGTVANGTVSERLAALKGRAA
jgi:chromosome segregation ATPase